MANASTTGFGFRPIKKIAQNYNNAALSEYSVAASSALISHACLVQLTANGVVLASGNTDTNNLGTLNGVFYTDATSNKPTFSNFSPASNTATDIVAFINDDPMQMFEVMSADTAFNQNEVGHLADQVLEVGTKPVISDSFTFGNINFISLALSKILLSPEATPIIFIRYLFAYFNILFNSEVFPEYEKTIKISFFSI